MCVYFEDTLLVSWGEGVKGKGGGEDSTNSNATVCLTPDNIATSRVKNAYILADNKKCLK